MPLSFSAPRSPGRVSRGGLRATTSVCAGDHGRASSYREARPALTAGMCDFWLWLDGRRMLARWLQPAGGGCHCPAAALAFAWPFPTLPGREYIMTRRKAVDGQNRLLLDFMVLVHWIDHGRVSIPCRLVCSRKRSGCLGSPLVSAVAKRCNDSAAASGRQAYPAARRAQGWAICFSGAA